MGEPKKEPKKFQHIGGESEKARVSYLNTDTKFKQAVTDLAAQYKVPAKLVFSRLVREGIVDEAIHRNNVLKGQPFVSIMDDPTYIDKDGLKYNLNSPYSYFGMDTAGGRMRQGRIKTNRPIPVEYYMENNGLEDVETFNTANIYDALELNVADIAARRNAAKKLYPKASEDELNEITGAFYNNSILTAKELVKNGEHRTKYKIEKDIEGLRIPKARTYPLRKDNVNYDGYAQLNPLSVTPKEGDPNAPLYSQESQGESYADFKERERQKQIDSYNATHNIHYGTSIPSYYNPYIDEGNVFDDGGKMETKNAKNARIAGDITAIGGAASKILDTGVQAAKIGDTSGIESQIQQTNADANNLTFSSNDELMNQWDNTADIGNVTWRDIRGLSKAGMAGSAISSTASGAAAGMQVGGPWGAAAGAVVGLGSALAGIFTGNRKAKKKARQLNNQINTANARKDLAFSNAADDLNEENAMILENNYAAFGGDLQTHGGDFPTGIISIDEGGTHESNVNGGVPMGMDAQGIPNLVEQGEVVYNDYVFSDRLKVPKGMRGKYGKRKDITFADAAKKISKESEERPNDPISKLGLEKQMAELMMGQEFVRASMPKTNSYACGGHKKDGLDYTQFLMPVDEDTKKKAFRSETELEDDNFTMNGNGYGLKEVAVTPTQPKPIGVINPILYPDNTREDLYKADIPLPGLYKELGYGDIGETDWMTPKYNKKDFKFKLAKVKETDNNLPEWMRYVPAVGAGLNVFTDAIGLTNKPDYTAAKAVEGIVNREGANRVSFTPLGNYLQYKPLDRDYYTNKLRSQAAASRNAIMQGSSPSRYAAALASDYNNIQGLGKLAREAEEYNFNNRRAVAEFNRATDQTNSEGTLKAAMANQSELANLRDFRLRGNMAAQEMRQKAKAASDAARSSNWNTFLKNIGAIGTENKNQNMLNWLIRNNYFPKYKD